MPDSWWQHWEPGPGLGAGPEAPLWATRTRMCVHPQVCTPVALWLLMAAAFLPCSAKPWQTGRKQGSLPLQKAEIFHPELADVCNKKGNTFKRAIPRNGLSQACGKPQPLLDCVWGQVGPAIASPGGSMGLMGLGPHPFWGRAASRVGVLGLEEWSLERAPVSKVLRAPRMVDLQHSPPLQGPRDAGLLLQGTRTPTHLSAAWIQACPGSHCLLWSLSLTTSTSG